MLLALCVLLSRRPSDELDPWPLSWRDPAGSHHAVELLLLQELIIFGGMIRIERQEAGCHRTPDLSRIGLLKPLEPLGEVRGHQPRPRLNGTTLSSSDLMAASS